MKKINFDNLHKDKGDASSMYTSTSTKDKLREEKGKQNGDLTCARGTSTNGKHGDLTCKSGTSTNGNNRDVEIQTAGTRGNGEDGCNITNMNGNAEDGCNITNMNDDGEDGCDIYRVTNMDGEGDDGCDI